jgi:seryl-tRNA(Sec) selenium transferase
VTTTGAKVVEIDSAPADLEAAITGKTACIVYFPGTLAEHALPIEEVVRIAKAREVPVLVDAAAQIPPVSNLWHFTRDLGCTGVIFSGGKGLRGPQSSGLVLGKKELIAGMRLNGPPNQSIGRPMKVGKEELAGALAAVKYTLAQEEDAIIGEYEEIVHGWIEDLAGLPGVSSERGYPSEAGQPFPRTIVRVGPGAKRTAGEVIAALWDGTPKIAVGELAGEPNVFALNPQTLTPEEADIVSREIRKLLG